MELHAQANWEEHIIHAIQSKPLMIRRVVQRIGRGALRLKGNVQRRMPVDTGAAKASWGAQSTMPPAEPGDGIWEESDAGFTITQGSRREYIEYLNEGTSRQAPAGFLDAEMEAEIDRLEEEILDDWFDAFVSRA